MRVSIIINIKYHIYCTKVFGNNLDITNLDTANALGTINCLNVKNVVTARA